MAGPLNRDGQRYASRSKGSALSFLLDENSNNCRKQMESRGIKPKNHHRDNLKALQRIQESVKQQKNHEMQQKHINYKVASKYTKIDSKLKQTVFSGQPSKSLSPSPTPSISTNFILRNVSNIKSRSSLNAEQHPNKLKRDTPLQRKPPVPKRNELNISKARSCTDIKQRDFVSMNKHRMQEMEKKKPQPQQTLFVQKSDYGKVPEYLVQRKIEKEQLEQKKMEEEERKKIPPGMRKMTDEERMETLNILQENKAKVMNDIKVLPLVIETPSMIRRQRELNEKLKQIEETIQVFEKPTVFVAMDE